jgi:hypothetical protein
MTAHPLTTRAQAVRAFRELLAACAMSSHEYIKLLRELGHLAQESADDEMIVQRIYALQASERVGSAPRDQSQIHLVAEQASCSRRSHHDENT